MTCIAVACMTCVALAGHHSLRIGKNERAQPGPIESVDEALTMACYEVFNFVTGTNQKHKEPNFNFISSEGKQL